MPPSDGKANINLSTFQNHWKCWLMVAWVFWFGVQYSGMVLEKRGQRLWNQVSKAKTLLPSPFEISMMDGMRSRETSPLTD